MNTRETFGQRLMRKRDELNLTQDQLASKAGITRVSISKIEQGLTQSTRADTLFALAKALKCPPQWLLNGSGDENDPTIQSNISNGPPVYKFVPVINWVQAGEWTPLADQFKSDDIESYPCPVKCSSLTYALKIKGDSMMNRFEEGDIIFVDPELVDAINDKYVVAQLEDMSEATFKQLQIIDGKKYLKALNPDYPSDLRYLKINGNCTILGTVIAHLKPL
ncbi:LexA family protein [Photobacterium nomapromontoriensis]|uniref:LexA family protein n=1 Tax=Photobacterium nomapromontoriensis TaxID=2910237 RepID=UPI003D127ADE